MEGRLQAIENRLNELESREAFHELTIETLNQALIEQGKLLELLKGSYQQLNQKLASLSQNGEPPTTPLDEKPPHY